MESIETEDISTDRSLEGLEQTYKYPVNYSKRGVVLLKEYVNTSALSKHDLKHNVVGRLLAHTAESLWTQMSYSPLRTSTHPATPHVSSVAYAASQWGTCSVTCFCVKGQFIVGTAMQKSIKAKGKLEFRCKSRSEILYIQISYIITRTNS
ncbi:uncharacterized protein LOC125286777 isoform X1 [Alosa alosa]|uniref:uncharacterized protein LOC125286777 isoform X1 n=1 Tax=Alosa alosa TaxID=278164 RepID=UPI0020152524|nr:uncharacterized protein LOC125286777 isoform X1 [Alosa alosa]